MNKEFSLDKGFSFAQKLKEGLAHEEKFLALWGPVLGLVASPTTERRFDALHTSPDGSARRAELKTESRSLAESPNFFIERWSSIEAQSPGGPWQSSAHGVSLLYYWFPKDNTVFLFDSLPLLMRNIEGRKLVLKEVYNKAEEDGTGTQRPAFKGGGYAVKRSSLSHLCTQYTTQYKEENK